MNKGQIKTRVARIYNQYWDDVADAIAAGELEVIPDLVDATVILEGILEELEK